MFLKIAFAAAAALLITIATVSAAAQKVTYDSAPGTDFSVYKTYKWQRAEDARYPDAQSDRILVNAIDGELLKRGLTKTEGDDADLYVIYQLAVVDQAQWSSYTHRIGWPTGQSTLAGFPGGTTNSSKLIKIGWLIIDIYDVKQKKHVWQASATKTLGEGVDSKKMENNAKKAMFKVFKNYPPLNK
jgi:hypothetical protein